MMHTVYRLTPNELHRYRQHLLSLDADTRYMRFGFAITDNLIESVCDKIEQAPNLHKIFVIENNQLEVIGAGHIALTDNNVEFALSVFKQYRGRGIGKALLRKCKQWCQNRNIKKGNMVCLANNLPMRKLAAKEGLILSTSQGESEAVVTLPDANVYSVINELIENQWAVWTHSGRLNYNFAKTAFKILAERS